MASQLEASQFQVIPAVDVLGDEAVRLRQGDYGAVTARGGEPVALAWRFAAEGAALVHLVDLEGARSGRIRPDLVQRVAAVTPVQASGGIRTVADAEMLLDAGATRVVVGTAAFGAEDGLERFARALGERLVIAVDVRRDRVAVRGWHDDSGLSLDEALARCAAAGVARILCTAIERDGTMGGPDLALLRRVTGGGIAVLAAGGIRSRDDLAAVERTGCEGAVVGRALLEGAVTL